MVFLPQAQSVPLDFIANVKLSPAAIVTQSVSVQFVQAVLLVVDPSPNCPNELLPRPKVFHLF
jgi:hypothetical protein